MKKVGWLFGKLTVFGLFLYQSQFKDVIKMDYKAENSKRVIKLGLNKSQFYPHLFFYRSCV